jgi:opine dehydrogenase
VKAVVKKVAVLGAGHGGAAFAGHLTLKGFEVALYEHPKFKKNIDEIREKGGVELIGAVEGFGKLSSATTEMKDVLPGADIIMVTVPAFAQMTFMEAALPYLENGQLAVFNPDNFASLAFKEMLRKKGIKKDIKIAGTASLMYACRKAAPARVNIFGVKDTMPVAALPSAATGSIIPPLKELFSQFTPAKNVLEMGFANMNMIIHCPTAVLNAGRIEDTRGNFMFYWQGMTESVCRVMEKNDEERVKVGEKLGLKVLSTHETLKQFYSYEKAGVDLHDFLVHSRVHGGHGPDAPSDLYHRYIREDVPCGLVPVSSFGKLLGVPTPSIDAIILLSSIMNKTDYFKEGRTIEKMGLSGMSAREILEYCEKMA